MVARPHYDDDILNRFLLNPSNRESDGVAAHVEQCERCQSQLETLSQEGLTWNEVKDLLQPLDGEVTREPHTAEPSNGNGEMTFLDGSNHPDSLGRFGRYEIMELLGRGGMGIVMRGFDPALNRHSAIKVLAPELAGNAAARRRFSREAKSAAAVVHPHVVPIQTVDEHNGLPYLVMPVVEGRSVNERVRAIGPLSVIEIVRITMQIAEGLAAAHEQGLVHRDIKPANILLENGVERVQITDFGLARAVDDAGMTHSGVIAGTPQYMSPEQAHGDTIDHRSDLFSLGSLMYFMGTGHSPFRGETTMGVLNRISNDAPRPLRSVNAEIPAWLDDIVMRLLEKRPADRFASADEVATLLGQWLAHLQTPDRFDPPATPVSPQTAPKQGRGRRWLVGLAGGFALLLCGILIAIETSKGTITIESNEELGIPIRITKNEETVSTLTVMKSGTETRLRAGDYQIELAGPVTGYEIINGNVTLQRGDDWVARIVSKDSPKSDLSTDFPSRTIPVEPRVDQYAANTKLSAAVDAFNREFVSDANAASSVPLSKEEVLTCLRWKLRYDEIPNGVHAAVRRFTLTHEMPPTWKLEAKETRHRVPNGHVTTWEITLNVGDDVDPILIRRYALSPPEKHLTPTVTREEDATGMPLEAAINGFNTQHRSVAGISQPPLTVEEVLAAIALWQTKRHEASVDNATFESFQRIAETHELPADARFSLISSFGPGDGQTYFIWSVRIVLPQAAKPGWTYGFTIRRHYVTMVGPNREAHSTIQWGSPAENGLQAGFRLIPSQYEYMIDQVVEVEFYYRNVLTGSLPATIPNAFTYREVRATTPSGNIDAIDRQRSYVAGAVGTTIGEEPTKLRGQSLRLAATAPTGPFDPFGSSSSSDIPFLKSSPRNHVGTYVVVEPGQTCTLSFTVPNLVDVTGESLETGTLTFKIADQEF